MITGKHEHKDFRVILMLGLSLITFMFVLWAITGFSMNRRIDRQRDFICATYPHAEKPPLLDCKNYDRNLNAQIERLQKDLDALRTKK